MTDRDAPIRIRQSQYLNNLVELDHRAIKRRMRPMLGFKTFRGARTLPPGIEVYAYDRERTDEVRSRNPSSYDLVI